MEYQNKHYNIDRKDEGKLDDQGRDGRTNFILRIKEQETRLTLQDMMVVVVVMMMMMMMMK
jgi:hypothetical protein